MLDNCGLKEALVPLVGVIENDLHIVSVSLSNIFLTADIIDLNRAT